MITFLLASLIHEGSHYKCKAVYSNKLNFDYEADIFETRASKIISVHLTTAMDIDNSNAPGPNDPDPNISSASPSISTTSSAEYEEKAARLRQRHSIMVTSFACPCQRHGGESFALLVSKSLEDAD